MANNDKDNAVISSNKKIKNQLDLLSKKMDNLYQDTYITRADNINNINSVINDLDDAINRIASIDNDNVGNMSELLRRIDKANSVDRDKLMGSVRELFNDNNLIETLFSNTDIYKYISAENYNYDMICRFLPTLIDALKIKADNVLSSDNFANKFLYPQSVKTTKDEVALFSINCDRLEKTYELSEFLEKTYMNVSKYGEDFIYCVPYTKAFERLLKLKKDATNGIIGNKVSVPYYESSDIFWNSKESKEIIEENYIDSPDYKKYLNSIKDSSRNIEDTNNKFKGHSITLYFNESGIPLNPVNENTIMISKKQNINSLNENNTDGNLRKDYDKLTGEDGLIVANIDKDIKIDKNINGSVLERLPREDILPVYIGNKCLGYYYLEIKEDKTACGYCGGHHMTPMISNAASNAIEMSQDQEELAIRYISSKISQYIDSKFINSNKDLKNEIYAVLRYNEKFDISRSNDIGVTFIPQEDLIHCYFELDDKTHRGISDLKNALIPAMLYILLYLSDIIGKVTRSYDKRVYYVKQNVEQNVARTMMNVINQIKKGNMGMRQIESMNNILNIVGRYNDYIIPKGQSGDPPIEFEVMQGQQIETPSDLMEQMKEAAVNATGVPMELVNATFQQDFASRFSMSNTRFLKMVNKRQEKVIRFFSKIFTRLYNNEFNTNYSSIEIKLPPPIYLTMTNNQQLIDNVSQSADKIIEVELNNEPDEIKSEFKKLYIRDSLSTFLNYNFIDRLVEAAKVNYESSKEPAAEDGENSNNDFDDNSDY